MDYRKIAELTVSAVGIGCWTFGRTADEATVIDIVRAAVDNGVTFFDVSDNYGGGHAEELLARGLAGRRPDVVIATKFGSARGWDHRTAEGFRANSGGGAPGYIRQCVEDSLRRLGTDYIDLIQMHDPDPDTPVEVTLQALDDLVSAGKVRHIGCSNHSAEQLRRATEVAAARGLAGFVTAQNHYSLLHRLPESDLLPFCQQADIRLIPYFPLANGVLTGKYRRGAAVPDDTRLGRFIAERRQDKAARFLNPRNLERAERLTAFAEDRGRTLLELAFGWLLAQPSVPSVIAGVSTAGQVLSNVRGSGWALTRADLEIVDRILDDGHPVVCQA